MEMSDWSSDVCSSDLPSNQPHSRHGASPCPWTPTPSPRRARVCLIRMEVCLWRWLFGNHSLLWGEVPVDGAWLSLWDLGPNTKGARKMMTTMPIAVHASEDGSKLLIWAWCLRRIAVGYASLWRMGMYLPFSSLVCVIVRQMLTTYRSKYISVSEIRPAVSIH